MAITALSVDTVAIYDTQMLVPVDHSACGRVTGVVGLEAASIGE